MTPGPAGVTVAGDLPRPSLSEFTYEIMVEFIILKFFWIQL